METTTNQENKAMLMDLFHQLFETSQTADASSMSEESKFKAAYALNLCTVSVSQIIDYNDVNFLEHEYEAILNNLNLEEMPKDEALLHILKQLLDVITFFRIQEGERKLLEKEYQQKMKNAIWNAVPNIGLIVAGGNPVTMAISLASQVGIGYMNYRKEKAQIGLEQERKEWELQRSAIEQFNGLRRELFDTAWRLAKKYQFPDEFRLTERQIAQFNRILMDPDDLRRYERLYYVKDKFIAYPPFWYYLGNAANAVSQNMISYGEQVSAYYKGKARTAFEEFLKSTTRNLLREDQLEASCALELFDLLEDNERGKKIELLERAQNASGNALDVLELCAMSYFKIGEIQKAADLFRMLVNEDYNTKVNAQLLSRIYVSQAIESKGKSSDSRNKYRILQSRVGAENLFPMPAIEGAETNLSGKFLDTQKDNLREAWSSTLTEFIYKFSAEYDALCKAEGNISKEMIELLDRMCNEVKKIAPDNIFIVPLQKNISNHREDFQNMLISNKTGVQGNTAITFYTITSEAFYHLSNYISKRIDGMDSMLLITESEMDLEQFCIDNSLRRDQSTPVKELSANKESPIGKALSDKQFRDQQILSEKAEECVDNIQKVINSKKLIGNDKRRSVYFYVKEDNDFNDYLKRNEKALLKCRIKHSSIVAIINDRSISDQDLILTTERVYLFEKKKSKGYLVYAEVAQSYTQKGLQFGKSTFANSAVNISVLREITDALASLQGKYQETSDNEDIEKLIRTIKRNIATKTIHHEYTNYTKSAQKTIAQHKTTDHKKTVQETTEQHKNSAVDKGNLENVQMESNNSTLYMVEATVSKGPLFIGNYCALNGVGLYTILILPT